MGGITVTVANYVVGPQVIDVSDYLEQERWKNFGEIKFAVAKLDAFLRSDNRITLAPDSTVLASSPPNLHVEYTDETGAFHSLDAGLNDTLDIGEQSFIGKLIRKPGAILWDLGIMTGNVFFIFVFAMTWALTVLWSLKQWEFIANNLPREGPYDRFGLLGHWVAVATNAFLRTMDTPSKFLGPFVGVVPAPYSWLTKWFFAFLTALSPVPGFFFQLLIWITLVQTLQLSK